MLTLEQQEMLDFVGVGGKLPQQIGARYNSEYPPVLIALIEAGRLKFTETTEALLGRFRRVEVELNQPTAAADALPVTWLEWKSGAGRASFVDSAYGRDTTERACRERFPVATMQAHTMTLREIFITLARAGRTTTKGAAA